MVNVIHQFSSGFVHCCASSSSPPHPPRGIPGKMMSKCSFDNPFLSKVATSQARQVISRLAASIIFLSQTNQVGAADLSHPHNICQLASAADDTPTLPFDQGSDGQGQEDCHCTQGVYTFDMEAPSIQVDTFCVHGGPDGYITGIRGKVQCLPEEDLEKNVTDVERQEMIREKCYLRFPTLPFIPKEPYDVIATDYDNFALVSGAKDKSFIQIYSRKPVPGPEFIEKYKSYLANFGYDPSKIKDTPQDCEVMSNSKLAAMMSMSGMQQALTNQFPDLGLKSSVEFNPFTSVFDTLKKLLELYFK
ncbi:hypothetical protein LWI28_011740 [Acer negundo]|uniref:Chloroplastic lipocalin n=1 Tax=Acer negundo TaxID=4023 RepID=A0AAD5NZ10_ACENE|nr:hypothetical protein LWI28_011740 [Acer negundo]